MSQLLGSFRHNSGGGWAHGLSTPHYAPIKLTKAKSQDHSVIHNFFSDIRNAAVGIPMGMLQLGKAVGAELTGNPEPLNKIAMQTFHSFGYMYGPAFHGHLGTTLHRMGQHPLQPLLDAVTIVTAPIGGVGAGVKAADQAAFLGARIGVVSAERSAQLNRAANFFRPSTRAIHEMPGHPVAYEHVSGNPTIRAMHGLSQGTKLLLAKSMPETFGEGKAFDLSQAGMDARAQGRYLKLKRSEREHAVGAMLHRELSSARNMFKDPKVSATDIAEAIKPQIRSVAEMHAFRMKPEHLLGKKAMLENGWLFLTKKDRYSEYPRDKSVAEFGRWLTDHGKSMTTPKPQQALRDGEGNYLVVRNQTMKELNEETGRTHKALRILLDNPTKVWKWMVLATAPRYFVNNVVGNGLMYAMAANPVDTTRAMLTATTQLIGEKRGLRALNDIEQAQQGIIGDWVSKWYSATTEGFGREVTRDMRLHNRFKNPVIRKGVGAVGGGLFGVTQYASDTIPRRAMVNLFIRRNPKYQAEFRRLQLAGVDRKTAHRQAADSASSHADVRFSVAHQVDNILGQYHHFNRTEKALKRIIPFYSWDRAIVRHSFHLASERPLAAVAIAQLGQQGAAQTQQVLGDVPDFLKGVIPLKELGIVGGGPLGFLVGGHTGRESVLSTQGANPYAALPDTTDFLSTLIHGSPKAGESLAGQLNPLITGAIEHYTGQSLLSGRAKPTNTGLLQDVSRSVVEATPTVRLAETAIQGRPHPKKDKKTGKIKSPFLFRSDTRQQLSSFVGVPVKEMNKAKAAELFRREKGVSVPRVRTKPYKPVKFGSFKNTRSSSGAGLGHRGRHTSLRPRHPRRKRNFLPKTTF